jgi:hypothetical protein
MESAILRVHSVVDVITNSSSEIYVEATEHTIDNVKELVDNLFSLAGSPLKCDDVFDITLKNRNAPDEDEDESYYDETYPEVDLVVTPKEGVTSEESKIASRILSSLTSIFSIESQYNG